MIFKTKTTNSISFLSLHFQVRFPKLLPLFGEQLSLRVIQGITVNSCAAERGSQALLSRRDGAGNPRAGASPQISRQWWGGVCGGVNAPIWSPAPSLSSLLDCSIVHTVFHVLVCSPYSRARAPPLLPSTACPVRPSKISFCNGHFPPCLHKEAIWLLNQ